MLRDWLSRLIRGANHSLFEAALDEERSRPGAGTPMTKGEFVRVLRELAGKDPRTSLELAQLEAALFALGERVRVSQFVEEVPHGFWHFVSDADVRFEDQGYAADQRAELFAWLDGWEADAS